ncbi:MAG: hypothetical protein E6H94_12875 [Chloroflexi bacterium]|nr:MAG: hypothetical protein E6H94_12875 [Chloroflexota bacterium]
MPRNSLPVFPIVATSTSPVAAPAGTLTDRERPLLRTAVVVAPGWIVVSSFSLAVKVQVRDAPAADRRVSCAVAPMSLLPQEPVTVPVAPGGRRRNE